MTSSEDPSAHDCDDETDSAGSSDFEASLGEIERIVRDLEGGELSLDESLQAYETAVGKMRHCYRLLDAAERKIALMSGFDAEGNPILEAVVEDASVAGDPDELKRKQAARGRRRGAGPTPQSAVDDEIT